MGRLYNGLKNIRDKMDKNLEYAPYQQIIESFINLVTYEDTYLQKKLIYRNKEIFFRLKRNGKDMLIDCMNFGIIVTEKDAISIHT